MLNADKNGPSLSQEQTNFSTLHDILSSTILTSIAQSASPSTSKHARKKGLTSRKRDKVSSEAASISHNDTQPPVATKDLEDLADFTEYLAHELFTCLPLDLQRTSPDRVSADEEGTERADKIAAHYTPPLSSATLATLLKPIPAELHTGIQTCLPAPSSSSQSTYILEQVLEAYCETVVPPHLSEPTDPTSAAGKAVVKAPPKPDTGCELCARPWIPLTQHHLIPRSAAPKVVKRGWHTAEACQTSIAWLCRACHSFVHGLASNDELAREWYSVELLEEREDVQRWIGWVGRVRWKAR